MTLSPEFWGQCYTGPTGEVHFYGAGARCQCGKCPSVSTAGVAAEGSERPDLRVIRGGRGEAAS